MNEGIPVFNGFPENKFFHNSSGDDTSTWCLIGASRSGKTTMMAHIWRTYFKRSHITLLLGSNLESDIYNTWKDKRGNWRKSVVASRFDQTLIETIVQIQQKSKRHYKFLVIIDDTLSIHGSRIVDQLFMSYRNLFISSILCIQGPRKLSPAQRDNCNNMMLGRFSTPAIRQESVDLFFGHKLMNQKDYERLTKDHQFLSRNAMDDSSWFVVKLTEDQLPVNKKISKASLS